MYSIRQRVTNPAKLITKCKRTWNLARGDKWLPTSSSSARAFATITWSSSSQTNEGCRPVWSPEWESLGLGAQLINTPRFPKNLMFVQVGFGVDQHGEDNDATKASMRAVRNAIEFNSIPGVVEHIPGGRKEMLIHVKLGVPTNETGAVTPVDVMHVAKVFPYGKLLPIEIVPGGLDFATGRVVEELGDTNWQSSLRCCLHINRLWYTWRWWWRYLAHNLQYKGWVLADKWCYLVPLL